MSRWIVLAVGGLLTVAACSSGSSSKPAAQSATTTTTTAATPATADTQVWLCNPEKTPNPCLSDLTTTVIGPEGTKTVQKAAPATDPKIDCFYVYPTVSQQTTDTANMSIDPAETNVAIAQAARYSQTCRMYAPIYPQRTLIGLGHRNAKASEIAYDGAVAAWKDYLTRYNDGRGVVLIGHSQGAGILTQLIGKEIEPDAAVRARIVSAILLGGNVLVPEGKDVGGDFKDLAACHSATETGCVIAFSSFNETPPAAAIFGRSRVPGQEVLCTNPAALGGGTAPIHPYYPTRLSGGVFALAALPIAEQTPWVAYPDLFTAECKNEGGASWLQINDVRKPGDNRPKLRNSLGPTWGLHLYDGNIALGDLTKVVQQQAEAYLAPG